MAKEYTRLPGGQGFTVGEIHQLWMGKDHILSVANSRFHEAYRRFYFKDIEAFVARKTATGSVLTALSATPALILGVLAAGADSRGVSMASGLGAVLFLMAAALNLYLGPTCRTDILTAVSTVRLPSLGRLRTVRRFLDRVTPLIDEAQGKLTGELLDRSTEAGPFRTRPFPRGRVKREEPGAGKPSAGTAHGLLFGTLLLSGLIDLVHFSRHGIALFAASAVVEVLATALIVAALVAQQRGWVSRLLAKTVRGTLVALVGKYLLGYALYMSLVMETPFNPSNYRQYIEHLAGLAARDSRLYLAALLFSFLTNLSLGALGLFALLRHRREIAAPKGAP